MFILSKATVVMLIGVSSLSGCSFSIPARVHDPGVAIETVSTESGQIRSVGFWTDRDGLTLRGEVLPNSSGKIPEGHVDISITVPDRSSTVCSIAKLYRERSHNDGDFSHSFVSLPPRGSRVRVWYHPETMTHGDCAG